MLHNPETLNHRKHFGKFASSPTTSNSFNMAEVSGHQKARKSRRGEVTNPANTLDGLVAKRADDRIDIDPDVSARTCSVCGYQGKWVSEMIRHKRVHTSERPFRCKYCSRTSKWKADLVRHVAKTHGIRVVSKYSRSKVFQNNTSVFNIINNTSESNEKNQNSAEILTDLKNDKNVVLKCRKPETFRLPTMYRCIICLFEQDSVLALINHLKNAHNALPYECHSCDSSFMDAHATITHFIENTTCKRTDLKINIAPPHCAKNKFILDEAAKLAAQELFRRKSVITSSNENTSQNTSLLAPSFDKFEMKQSSMDDNNRNEKVYLIKENMVIHTKNPSFQMQLADETARNSIGIQMQINADNIARKDQTLEKSRFFNFGALLSALKQQATFDSPFSMREQTLNPTLLSKWVPPSPSAFKQVTLVPEESKPVKGFIPYPRNHGTQDKKIIQQLHSSFCDTVDNISRNSMTVISNFSPDNYSKNFCFVNSIPSPVSEGFTADFKMSDINSSSSHHAAEDVIKAIQYYCQRRNAFFPSIGNKTQTSDGLPESDEKKSEKCELQATHDRNTKENYEDDFVDVVQLDG